MGRRAFTLEFWTVDLATYFDRRRASDSAALSRTTQVEIDPVYEFLAQLNTRLAEVRRHVGYRAAGEVIDLLCSAAEQDLVADEAVLWSLVDDAVYAKVLPRLRGHQSPELDAALAVAIAACRQRELARCVDKLVAMKNRLDNDGFTRFFA